LNIFHKNGVWQQDGFFGKELQTLYTTPKSLGRPRCRWKKHYNRLKEMKWEGADCSGLGQRPVVLMNLQLPLKCRKFPGYMNNAY
jgi:hypothetical protein